MDSTLPPIIMIALALVGLVTLFILGQLYIRQKKLGQEVDFLREIHGLDAGAVERVLPYLADLLMNLMDNHEVQAKGPADHTFSIKVIEEVSKVSRIIDRFDDKVNGVKPIKRSVQRILANLKSLGYECSSLVGNKYHDGSTIEVQNFISDPSILEGTMIISKVLQQEIKFWGVTIQEPIVEVSQNG